MDMKQLACLRCGGAMRSHGIEKLQLGKYGFVLGHLSNLFSGAIEAEIFSCASCGKLEFFRTFTEAYEGSALESGIAQKPCPDCGKYHDIDWPQCPYCHHDYRNER